MKCMVVAMEKELLRSFGFLLHTGHPHRFLLTYLNTLELQYLMQDAWNIVNDSFRTTLCVRFKSEVVACGAIFMVARKRRRQDDLCVQAREDGVADAEVASGVRG